MSLKHNIHPDDPMVGSQGKDHYLQVGYSALRCIREAISSSIKYFPEKEPHILDYACGYGRVARHLRVSFPNSRIYGVDINNDAISYCVSNNLLDHGWYDYDYYLGASLKQRFNVEGFDLIWCGSLITHLCEHWTKQLIANLSRALNPGGICVFSSHGEYTYSLLKENKYDYCLEQGRIDDILANYEHLGSGYRDYEGQHSYGVSAYSFANVNSWCQPFDWKMIYFKQRAWDNHQDIYAYQKNP